MAADFAWLMTLKSSCRRDEQDDIASIFDSFVWAENTILHAIEADVLSGRATLPDGSVPPPYMITSIRGITSGQNLYIV